MLTAPVIRLAASHTASGWRLIAARRGGVGAVPPYKFKGNSARKELQRNASSDGGPHVKRYYHGWCEYIKMCRQFEGSILFPEELPVALWLDTESDGVRMLEPNKFHDLSKSAVPGEFAIAVLHPEKDTFEGIKEMREISQAQIKIGSDCEPGTDSRKVIVIGTPEQTQMALTLIQQRLNQGP